MIEPSRLYPVEAPPGRSDIYLADIARGLYRNRWLVIGIAAAVIAAAAVFTVFQTPEYESEAAVQIHFERAARSSALTDLGAAIGLGDLVNREAGRIGTDILVMQSRGIIEHIADSLTLHVQMTEPRAARVAVFSAVDAPRNVVPATVEFRHRGNGVYDVRVEPASEEPPRRAPGVAHDPGWDPEAAWRALFEHPARVEVGQPFEIGNVDLTLDPALSEAPPDRITVEVRDFRGAVEAVRSNLDVATAQSGTQIILVGYRHPDPVLVAAVPNAITSSFVRHKIETSQWENRSRGNFLREQVGHYAGTLEEAEARLQAFREREQVINAPAQATEQVRHYAELLSHRDEIVQERDALHRLLARLRNETSPDSAHETYRELAAFPVFFVNSAIQNIIRSLIELENQRAELMIRRTEESIDVRGIDTRVRELELQLLETAESYLASRENQLASLDATLSQFADLAGQVPAREVALARLTREQELLTEIYGELQLRLHEVEVEEAVEPLDVQLLDPALVPNRPVSPRPMLNLVLGAFLGIALGLLAAFTRQIVDTKVRSRHDVRIAAGGLPVMATIPRIASGADRRVNGRLTLRRLRRARPELGRVSPLVARDAPRSPAAEAYRALRTRVFFRRDNDAPRILILTSAAAGEGKSTSAANLAVTLSHQGVATLLIDGDLRRGTLHEIFGVDRTPGLAEVLREEVELGEALRSIELAGGRLDILPSGAHPENPSELIGGQRMELVLQDLIDRYDRILIDTPPLRSATDAAVLCSMPYTGALMVARAGFSDRHAIEEVARELQEMGIRVDGVIINDVAVSERPAYGYHSVYAD